MPTEIAESFDVFTMVSHGPSTHDFNPVSGREVKKLEGVVKDSLKTAVYAPRASKFVRVQSGNARIGAQYFNDTLLLLATFAPQGFDDIDFGVGLAVSNLAKAVTGAENVVLVDCHNSFKGEGGRILPGNREVFELMEAVEKLPKLDSDQPLRIGCAHNPLVEISKDDGVGQSGLKVMVVEVAGERTAYIVLDSNNMKMGFRARIMDALADLDIQNMEVMTTDTHFVNTLSGGHNPVGTHKGDEIINAIVQCTKDAIADIEDVEVASDVAKIEGIKTMGPLHSTELVTTISSIVAVSRIFAPLMFIFAFLFAFLWIFYWAL